MNQQVTGCGVAAVSPGVLLLTGLPGRISFSVSVYAVKTWL
jgi:hypothetical protein